MDEKRRTQISRRLSLVLRHDPASVGITLDESGWTDVDELLVALNSHGTNLTLTDLEEIVHTSDKQRFALDEPRERIRANQGHSVPVELGLTAKVPPDDLFHGTVERFLPSILELGLLPGQRHHVHLSADVDTATGVGARRGRPIVLRVAAGRMAQAGSVFFQSANGVWLTDHVAPQHLSRMDRATQG